MKSIAERGILILATGHELYAKLAFNLALSIKANDRHIKVAMICDKKSVSCLTPTHLKYFDHLYEIPQACITLGDQTHHFKAKTHLYDLTPFDKTLFLDADTLFCPNRKISWLFGELDEVNFSIPNNGYFDPLKNNKTTNGYLWWGDLPKIKDYYNLKNKMPQTNSTLIYFKKGETAEKIFKTANQIYCDNKAPKVRKKWGFADEFCFNVSMSLHNYLPHELNWHPVYIHFIKSNIKELDIMQNYWAITNGGHTVSPVLIRIYNRLLNLYCTKNGIPDRFYHIDKSQVIPERKP